MELATKFARALRAGGKERADALTRVGLGSMISLWAVNEALDGNLSGSGPKDSAARQALYATGWQPYSVKVGDEWVSYARMEPFATVMGLAADFAAMGPEMTSDERKTIAGRLSLLVASNLISKTYLRGLSEFVSAVTNPDRHGSRWVRSMATGFVPAGPLLGAIRREPDPVRRDVQGITDALQSRLPGLSASLPPKRSPVTGEVSEYGGSVGPDLVSPLYTSQETGDVVATEMPRLGMGISSPSRKLDGVDLTDAEYQQLVKEGAREAHRILEAQIRRPSCQRQTPEQREERIRKVYTRARNIARGRIRSARRRSE